MALAWPFQKEVRSGLARARAPSFNAWPISWTQGHVSFNVASLERSILINKGPLKIKVFFIEKKSDLKLCYFLFENNKMQAVTAPKIFC